MNIFKYNNFVFIRNIHTTYTVNNSQTGRFMKKVLKENRNKRKWQIGDQSSVPDVPLPSNLVQGATEGRKSANSKRVTVLNKLFMRHITDLMATGDNSSLFLGRGLEINRVAVTPDFRGVNVFWIAKGTENDEAIEKLLNQHSGALRHELSQLKVMGVVPKINFVKDKAYAKVMEVDLRLAQADFGQDYVPVDPSHKFKSEFYLNTSLPLQVRQKIENLETENPLEESEEPLPPMRMDILGLNYAEIMLKVQKSIKKSQAAHRKTTDNLDKSSIPSTVNPDPIEYSSYKQQREAFQQFLLKRQILRAKAKRESEKYNPEYEYFQEEKIQYFDNTPFSDEINGVPKEDFIVEDEFEDSKSL